MTIPTNAPGGAVRRELAPVPEDAAQFAVRMRDGIRLATDVFVAGGAVRRTPALLIRTPYDKAGQFLPDVARWFVDRGYTVVLQDTRGKARSEGDPTPFVFEQSDGYDTIDWIVAQPWCNGSVGMLGESYLGYTQWAAAAAGHSALRAIVPRVTTPSFAEEFALGGVFRLGWVAEWAANALVDEYFYDVELEWARRPICDIVPAAFGWSVFPLLDGWAVGDYSSALPARINPDVPALHFGGWWDLFRRDQIRVWGRAHSARPSNHYLMMDAIDHNGTLLGSGESWEASCTSPSASQLDEMLAPIAPFLDLFVRGVGGDPASVRWRPGWGDWRQSERWPPPNAQPTSLYLHRTKTLSERPAASSAQLHWEHNPHDPVPSISNSYDVLTDPPNDRILEGRDDVLRFVSQPSERKLELAGPVSVTLEVTSSARSAHVMAKLIEIESDGRSFRIAEGTMLAREPWPAAITVDLGDVAYCLAAGRSLQLDISSSAFPEYILHPGSDEVPWTATDLRVSRQTLAVGGSSGARLMMWTLPQSEDGSIPVQPRTTR